MTRQEKHKKIKDLSIKGTITTKQVSEAGLYRGILKDLVNDGELYRFSRGLYVINNEWEDDFYLLQQRYERGIYSHETALYLLGYSDRAPIKYTMTFPKGYNSPSIKEKNINIKRSINENYFIGVIELKSPCGNIIHVYDLEKTLCDILRGNNNDIQIINAAMKKYAASKNKDLNKLMEYAEKLHVKKKVLRYMEVLL